MDIRKIIQQVGEPTPYVVGTDMMWTDSHISKHLLEVHINPEINLASRTAYNIDQTVNMIDEIIAPKSAILDLGCGPGLYTERLAQKGHLVTGVDFSKRSIAYALEQKAKNHSTCDYVNANYLELDYNPQFDMIMMIYCDFGVLVPTDREKLMKIIYKALKPGGIFIFDGINEATIEGQKFDASYEISEGGFWSESPYLCLSKSFLFKDYKATLEQHVVIREDDSFKVYRFWNHYFTTEDVEQLFRPLGYDKVERLPYQLSGEGIYNDHGVVFYKVTK